MNIYKSIKDDTPYIILEKGRIIEVGEMFTKLTEYAQEELLGKSLHELYDLLRMDYSYNALDEYQECDCYLLTKSYEVKEVAISCEVSNASTKVICYISEKDNFRFEDKFPYLLQLCKYELEGIAIHSAPDLILLEANQTYLNFLDAPFNTIKNSISRKQNDIVTGFTGSNVETLFKKVLESGKPVHLSEFKYDNLERGVTYWNISLIPIYIENKLKYIVETSRDITEKILNRQRVEEQAKIIEFKNRQLEAILDCVDNSVSIIDRDGNYITKNRFLKDIYGNISSNRIEDNIGRARVFNMNDEEVKTENFASYRVKRGETFKNEKFRVEWDGKQSYISISGIPAYDENGEFLIGIIVTHDITELAMQDKAIKHHQETALLAEREKNEALEQAIGMKDEFLSLISHELRTPLNVINTAVQAMELICREELSDKARSYIKTIKQNIYRQLRLVNNLLDITRADAGRINIHKSNIDIVFLSKAITESVYNYAHQKNISMSFKSSFEEKILGIDDEKYERVLLNLLSNAIKFTPEGKSISVKLGSLKDNIKIEVKDTGIGIPEDKVDVIFERFGQVDSSLSRRAEGAGIGLSLVKRLVEAFGGSITVKSKLGKGTSFIILLPDEMVQEESNKPMVSLMDNRLVEITTVEFSDIYL